VSQRQYEILFIAEQNLGEPEVDTLTATVKGFIEKENGTVEKVEKWGKKRLAYTIGKNREGSYVLMIANAPGSAIAEVERRMRVTDGILRFLAIRIDAEGMLDTHALAVSALPHHHRDPFDRLLVAQALEEPARLLTADRRLAVYSELVMVV